MNLSFWIKMFLSTLWIGLPLLWGITLAQDSRIGSISVKFCNDEKLTKELNLQADTEKDYEICIKFSNSMNTPVKIKYEFVDGVLTNDSFQNKACTNDTKTNFGQFVTQKDSLVTIPANGSIEQKATVRFPTWMAGVSNGCLVYSIDNEKLETQTNGNATFDVLVRKGYFINAFVGGEISRNLTLQDTIQWDYQYKKNLLTIKVPMINNGNIDEEISFDGELTNILSYQKHFSEEKTIYPHKELVLEISTDDIPWYQAFYTLKGTLTHKGKVSFDSSLAQGDTHEEKVIPVEIQIFIFPRVLILVILGAIILGRTILYLAKHLKFEKDPIN